MSLADFLRIFATARVDGLLLDEASTPETALAGAEGYRPVLNVAAHFEWPVWIRTDNARCWPQGEIAGVAGWLGGRAPEHAVGRWGSCWLRIRSTQPSPCPRRAAAPCWRRSRLPQTPTR